ncbi:MAG: hypothetical protein J5584_07760 [Clostridia bacterium]|nr:hypothetical protein [Clostridia bacterium]
MAVGFETVKENKQKRAGSRRILTVLLAVALLSIGAAVLTAGAGRTGIVRADTQPEHMEILFCDGTNQGNPRMFNAFSSVGFRFEVPDGYKLDEFIIIAAPTWGMQDNAGFTADIYEWRGSYNETLAAGPVAERCVISNHVDNYGITLSFGYVPAGSYLIHIHHFTNNIGSWESICLPEEYTFTWAFYEDGLENKDYLPGTKISVSRDRDPHAPARATPTATPGGDDTVTPEPEATDADNLQPARERLTEAPSAGNTVKNRGGLWAGIIVAAAAIAATAAVISVIARRDKNSTQTD